MGTQNLTCSAGAAAGLGGGGGGRRPIHRALVRTLGEVCAPAGLGDLHRQQHLGHLLRRQGLLFPSQSSNSLVLPQGSNRPQQARVDTAEGVAALARFSTLFGEPRAASCKGPATSAEVPGKWDEGRRTDATGQWAESCCFKAHGLAHAFTSQMSRVNVTQ